MKNIIITMLFLLSTNSVFASRTKGFVAKENLKESTRIQKLLSKIKESKIELDKQEKKLAEVEGRADVRKVAVYTRNTLIGVLVAANLANLYYQKLGSKEMQIAMRSFLYGSSSLGLEFLVANILGVAGAAISQGVVYLTGEEVRELRSKVKGYKEDLENLELELRKELAATK